ncbi:MAG: hypothetical protein KJ821_06200 [Actinobacteria bacterium]|nr:hypothetical protein [Actinomycetota bacterium]MBU4483651.1 hypothetical protein [Actinomycetota bacterium]
MAKPTKYATLICTIVSILALIGIVIGIWLSKPLIIVIFLIPAAAYEVYRTEGPSTVWASWILLIVLILEIVLIVANINFDLASFFGESEKVVAGYTVPLGDIKIVGPIVIAILSIILFVRTRGRYTKWLAAVIFITCFVIVYVINPEIFKNLLGLAVVKGIEGI